MVETPYQRALFVLIFCHLKISLKSELERPLPISDYVWWDYRWGLTFNTCTQTLTY